MKPAKNLSTKEINRISRFALWGREKMIDRRGSRASVLLLTANELFAGFSLQEAWEKVGGQLNARLRERVQAAANVRLKEATLDTDTSVHTLYGDQMVGRVSYNRKNRGEPDYTNLAISSSWQPMLASIANTRE